MVQPIPGAPDNVAAFAANGEVSAGDFQSLILPGCDRVVNKYGVLNYVLQLKNDTPNFTAGAWAQDMFLGLKHISKWNRCAIVTDQKTIHTITDVFSKLMPGEFRGFDHAALDEALLWCAGNNK